MTQMTSYIKAKSEANRVVGLCLICNRPIPVGEVMTILRYGGRGNDWGKSHTKCADSSDAVDRGAPVVEQPATSTGPRSIDYVELGKGQYRGLDKYAIRLNGNTVWYTSDRRRAEGAVMYQEAVWQQESAN